MEQIPTRASNSFVVKGLVLECAVVDTDSRRINILPSPDRMKCSLPFCTLTWKPLGPTIDSATVKLPVYLTNNRKQHLYDVYLDMVNTKLPNMHDICLQRGVAIIAQS